MRLVRGVESDPARYDGIHARPLHRPASRLKVARSVCNAGLVAVKPSKTERYAVTTNSSLFPRTHALGRISPTYLGTRSYSLSMKPAAR